MDKPLSSICSVYVELIEHELEKHTPDMDAVHKFLKHIKENCGSVPFAKGETPEHLKPYLLEKGDGEGLTGTVVYKGKPIPRTAYEIARKRKKSE